MNSDRLYYFSRSRDVAPGSGVNENIGNINNYIVLRGIADWRKKLSNFYPTPFDVSGFRWNSVEHMFQGYKLNLVNPQLAYTFSLNSQSPLSFADGSEAQKQRKAAILSPEQLAQWDAMKDNVLYHALKAKFTQNPELRNLLLATGTAELWHGAPRTPASRQYILEKVRSEL